MNRKEQIKEAYRSLGKANSVYDRMMTGSGLIGKAIDRIVWCMDKEDLLEYQARGMEAIPKDFFGRPSGSSRRDGRTFHSFLQDPPGRKDHLSGLFRTDDEEGGTESAGTGCQKRFFYARRCRFSAF